MTGACATLDELAAAFATTTKPLVDLLGLAGLATAAGHPTISARTSGYVTTVVADEHVTYQWLVDRAVPLIANGLGIPAPSPERLERAIASLRACPPAADSWERPAPADEF